MTPEPLVTIVTPVYNGARYLDATIASVRGQDYPHIEHIVIDDGSTDGGATVAILERYPHLRWWTRENRGQYTTMNEGLAAAKGDLVLFLSADDLLAPGAVRSAVEHFRAHPGCDAVYGRSLHINERGELLPVQTNVSGRYPMWLFRYIPFIYHCALFVRRELIAEAAYHFNPTLRYSGDADWIQRLIARGTRFCFIDQQLARYRIHTGQTVRTAAQTALEFEYRSYRRRYGANEALARAFDGALTWRSRLLKATHALRSGGVAGLVGLMADWRRRRAARALSHETAVRATHPAATGAPGRARDITVTPTVPRLPGHVQAMLRCPVCRAPLNQSGDRLECRGPGCGAAFPVVDGVPVLINECRSVFSIADIAARRPSFYGTATRLRRRVGSHIPDVGANFVAKRNLMKLTAALRARRERPVVLVIGGSRLGPGMEVIAGDPAIQLVETDIMAGTRTMVVCDGHDIPFEDGAFDGVIIQAVLEHVADPYRVVDEIHRVLKDDGVVYAETPFMEQVHGGRYDFTRFTLLGHRRLFRRFVEIDSGAVAGPGTALAWSYLYFLMSFTSTRPTAAETRVSTIARSVAKGFARLSGAWLKQFDRYLLGRPSALDAASATYFFGRKSAEALSDRALIRLYRGSG